MLSRYLHGLHIKVKRSRTLVWAAVGTGGVTLALGYSSSSYYPINELRSRIHEQLSATASKASHAGNATAQYINGAVQSAWSAVSGFELEHSDVATFVTKCLADMATSDDHRELLVAFGGSRVLSWLVGQACEDPSPVQSEAERAVISLLNHSSSAPLVLQQNGAVPRLLHHIASGKAADDLPDALSAAAAAAPLDYLVLSSDIRKTLNMLQGRHGSKVQELAAALVAAWAASSPVNRRKLTAAGLHAVVAEAVTAASGQAGEASGAMLQSLARVMTVMAGSEAAWESRHLGCWVQPALYIAADAAVGGNVPLSHLALETLHGLAVNGGDDIVSGLVSSQLLPFLTRLAEGKELRRDIGRVVSALAERDALPTGEREVWRQTLLTWLMAPTSGEELCSVSIDGLTALAAAKGPRGVKVAHYWLAALLDHLAAALPPSTRTSEPPVPPSSSSATYPTNAWAEGALVQPSYVRWVAADLRLAGDAVDASSRPQKEQPPLPGALLELLGPEASAAYPAAAQVVDAAVADQKVCTALEVLCALVVDDPTKQSRVVTAGVLPLLQRLCLKRDPPPPPHWTIPVGS